MSSSKERQKGSTVCALEKLRSNIRYRIERQPETIETSCQELQAVLQDRIQSLVSAMETGNAEAIKEMLGDVMYPMCVARDDDDNRSEGVAALNMWDKIMFYAVKVGVTFEGIVNLRGDDQQTKRDHGLSIG